MQWFLNLSTRAKLFLGFGVMVILLAAVVMTAYTGITAIQVSQKRLYQQDFANAVDLKDIRANQHGVGAALLSMMLLTKRSDQEVWHQEIKDRTKEIDETVQRILERGRNDPKLFSRLEEFNTISSCPKVG